jgi:hypothetical protein
MVSMPRGKVDWLRWTLSQRFVRFAPAGADDGRLRSLTGCSRPALALYPLLTLLSCGRAHGKARCRKDVAEHFTGVARVRLTEALLDLKLLGFVESFDASHPTMFTFDASGGLLAKGRDPARFLAGPVIGDDFWRAMSHGERGVALALLLSAKAHALDEELMDEFEVYEHATYTVTEPYDDLEIAYAMRVGTTSHSTLARITGLARSTCREALASLARKDLVIVDEYSEGFMYHLPAWPWQPPNTQGELPRGEVGEGNCRALSPLDEPANDPDLDEDEDFEEDL